LQAGAELTARQEASAPTRLCSPAAQGNGGLFLFATALARRPRLTDNEPQILLPLNWGSVMAPGSPSVSKPPQLSTEKVRHILNRWSGDGFFRPRKFGDKVAVNEVVAHSSYAVRLWSEYEERSVSRASKPYPGGPVDDRGQPPEPWTIAVRQPTDFEDRTEQVPVPHTEAVQTCTTCGGLGLTTCIACQGWGTVNCPACNGKGFRERQVAKTETGPGGAPTTRWETVRENCTCHGGKVTCTP